MKRALLFLELSFEYSKRFSQQQYSKNNQSFHRIFISCPLWSLWTSSVHTLKNSDNFLMDTNSFLFTGHFQYYVWIWKYLILKFEKIKDSQLNRMPYKVSFCRPKRYWEKEIISTKASTNPWNFDIYKNLNLFGNLFILDSGRSNWKWYWKLKEKT